MTKSPYLDPLFSLFIFSSLILIHFAPQSYPIIFFAILALISKRSESKVLFGFIFSIVITFIGYALFYKYAEWIWSKNIIVNPSELATSMRGWYMDPRDGIELQVVYTALFFTVICSAFVAKTAVIKKNLFLLFNLLSLYFIFNYVKLLPLNPPFFKVSDEHYIFCLIIAAFFLVFFSILNRFYKNVLFLLFALLLLPLCYLSTGPVIATSNYNYIFTPAWKLIKGFPLSEIYFQYDLFLSLLAVPFLILGKNPDYLQVIGHFSIFVFFMTVFFFANKFFMKKSIVIPFILTIVTVRLYASYYDPTFVFQITPLRLDLWLIPLLFLYSYGLSHWTVGLAIGMLVLFHRNFGIIYTLSYIQTLFLIFSVDLLGEFIKKKLTFHLLKEKTREFLRNNSATLAVVLVFFIISFFLFKDFGISKAGKIYKDFGFGFDRINEKSFFWYIPVLLAFTTYLLIQSKSKISEKYFNSSIFLVFLTIGNLLYFLGRSHESNLIWVASSAIFLIFICFDIFIRINNSSNLNNDPNKFALFRRQCKTSIVFSLPFLFFLSIVYFYSDNLTLRFSQQYKKISTGQFNEMPPSDYHIDAIKKITKDSENVYVITSINDFYIYYYGNYKPIAYFTPFESWIYMNELIPFLQNLLNQDYFIVSDQPTNEIISKLTFDQTISSPPYFILHKSH